MKPIRIAMWSGPRNISTAMMRSFENRADTSVVDEPFYAYYLSQTGLQHPMYHEVINSQSTDPYQLAWELTEKPFNTAIQYQKHMTHHMIEKIDLSWVKSLKHCFLIRNPKDILISYCKQNTLTSERDIGIIRQAELYKEFSQHYHTPIPVIQSESVLQNPVRMIGILCEALNIPFDDSMLQWPHGYRESDGVWAKHWYRNVVKSTKFQKQTDSDNVILDQLQQKVLDECMPAYEIMLKNTIV